MPHDTSAGAAGAPLPGRPDHTRGVSMSSANLKVVLVFGTDDQAWIRRESINVPQFWHGHGIAPMQGDVVRIGGRQFLIQGRAWEYEGQTPILRLYVGNAHAQSDTVFG
jgi:hypothetical protein